jgi:hypothetical protein
LYRNREVGGKGGRRASDFGERCGIRYPWSFWLEDTKVAKTRRGEEVGEFFFWEGFAVEAFVFEAADEGDDSRSSSSTGAGDVLLVSGI